MIHYPQDKVDAMIAHLAGLSERRLIISFAPKTLSYSILKRIGELFPGPSKVRSGRTGAGGSCQGLSVVFVAQSGHATEQLSGGVNAAVLKDLTKPGLGRSRIGVLPPAKRVFAPAAMGALQETLLAPPLCWQTCGHSRHHHAHATTAVVPYTRFCAQATRAYLHREEDVEAALQRAGFKVTKREMTATSFYFSRLLEAVRV